MKTSKPLQSALDADCVITAKTPKQREIDDAFFRNAALSRKIAASYNPQEKTGNYLVDMVWWTEKLDALPLGEMTRDHVRNALQWCLPRVAKGFTKDGYTYQEWVTAFTIRLLDPTLP